MSAPYAPKGDPEFMPMPETNDVKAAVETLENAGAQVEIKMHALTGELVLTIELSASTVQEG